MTGHSADISATRKEFVIEPDNTAIVVSMLFPVDENIETEHEFYKQQCEAHLGSYAKVYALLKRKMSELTHCRAYKRAKLPERMCAICNSVIEYEQCDAVVLPCGHNYHETCIRQWVVKSTAQSQATSLPSCPQTAAEL